MWVYLKKRKKKFRVPGRTGHGDTDLQNSQNLKNAYDRAKKKSMFPNQFY